MSLTQINHDIGRQVNGFMINTDFEPQNRELLRIFQQRLAKEFPNLLWLAPPESLHITLMDWIAPLVDYHQDKQMLFERCFPECDRVLTGILAHTPSIDITFDQLKVTPQAIILIGHDDGTMQNIRDAFLRKITLLPGTKQPPTIIHSTLARYSEERELLPLETFMGKQHITIRHKLSQLRLVHERMTPMLDYAVMKRYPLLAPR